MLTSCNFTRSSLLFVLFNLLILLLLYLSLILLYLIKDLSFSTFLEFLVTSISALPFTHAVNPIIKDFVELFLINFTFFLDLTFELVNLINILSFFLMLLILFVCFNGFMEFLVFLFLFAFLKSLDLVLLLK
jgi:hypothetical protein